MSRLLTSSLPDAFISADKSPSVIAFTAELALRSFVLIPAVSSSPKVNAAKVEAIPTINVTYKDCACALSIDEKANVFAS